MRFRYLIWDFDGTLFNTYPPLIRSITRALADYGKSESHETIAILLSDTLSETLDELSARHALDRRAFEGRVDSYQRRVTEHEQPPFLGVISLCERVLKAGGRNFIFTHRSRESMFNLLNWYRVGGLFYECLTVEDGFPRKPDPAGFVALIERHNLPREQVLAVGALIERHNLPREQVLAVGDRTLDIIAGQQAGVRTCLFRGDVDPNFPPNFVISSFSELKQVLQVGVLIN